MTIKVKNLSFAFGRQAIFVDLNTSFASGATLLMGANGAGKSTLLELVTSVRQPKSGDIVIDGLGSSKQRGRGLSKYRAGVAWLPQKFTPFPGLSVREQVAYSGWLKGMTRQDAWAASNEALALVDLKKLAESRSSKLSGGQQRRLGLACALVHDARVILLDEPTASLDPAQRSRFREVLAEAAVGRTVIVSSHDTDDAQSVFSRVAVLRKGEIVFHDSLEMFLSTADPLLSLGDRVESAYLKWAGTED